MIGNGLAVIIIIEVLITLFILWGFMHEGMFIDFEDRVIATIKWKIKNNKEKEKNERV